MPHNFLNKYGSIDENKFMKKISEMMDYEDKDPSAKKRGKVKILNIET